MTGIDISGVQPDNVPGNWDFIVVKSTEGNSVVNPRVTAQWAAASRTTRGLYHYARPLASTGLAQAQVFCDDALARGFTPGRDIWQLDAEDGENAGASGTTWRVFINDFMSVALQRLGRRGFLYAGHPFLVAHGLTDLPWKFMWWLPDYGRNDGQDHGYPDLDPTTAGLVVIHQFTSVPNLDQNRIINPAAYGQVASTPGGHLVKAKYDPPFQGIDVLVIPGKGVWGLQPDGGIYTFDGQFHGSAAGQAYFAGRRGARLVVPGTVVPGAAAPRASYPPSAVYEIIATSGERYVP